MCQKLALTEYAMPLRPIVKYPAPILKKKTAEVSKFDATLHELLDDMRQTMYAANGIGLAAPQVDVSQRVAVVDIARENSESPEKSDYRELINPIITTRAGEVESEEGCLSIPEFRETIIRNSEIVVAALDRDGKEFELKADGLLAICIQHEIDHLDGILFIDRMSRLKREFFVKWMKKHGPYES